MIFPIDTTLIERSTTLEDTDLGKWCFYINGALVGFCRSRREAEDLYGYVFN